MKEIKIKSANETIYNFNAPTGLPVYMWVNHDKSNVHMSLVVKYGSTGINFKCSNNKYSVPTGTAHFLEHIKFHLKDNDASNLFYDLGCDSNAYTSLNETSFEVYANDNIYEAAKLLLNFVYDNYFTKKIVDNERGIILEECNSSKDDPSYQFFRETTMNYLTKSTYRYPVIGTEKDIKTISIDDVSLVHDFFYRPENMFMVITGDFDPKEMMKTINENESNRTFKNIGKVSIIKSKEPKGFIKNYIEVSNKNVMNTHGTYIIKALESDFKGYTKDEVLVSLRALIKSNFSITSDFYEDIIQNNIATKFGSSVAYDDGVFGISFNYVSENCDEVVRLITEKLKNLVITKDDIDRLKKNYIMNSIMRFDSIYAVSSFIVGSIIDDNKISENKYEILNKLTIKKINEIFSRVDLDNKMIAIMKKS
ncbi:MAG: insulinase family protein [Bacilli bacterium]|nr:insulinase family protein [Bacilli bacterium]